MEHEDTTNGAWRSVDGRFWELPHRRFLSAGKQTRHADGLRRLVHNLQLRLGQARTSSPFHALQAVRAIRNHLDEVEREAVALARSYGWSWGHVAYALGTTRAAAHKRFARAETFRPPAGSRASTRGSPAARTPPASPAT